MVFEVFIFKTLLAHLFTLLLNIKMALERSAVFSFRVTAFLLVVLQKLSIFIFKSYSLDKFMFQSGLHFRFTLLSSVTEYPFTKVYNDRILIYLHSKSYLQHI